MESGAFGTEGRSEGSYSSPGEFIFKAFVGLMAATGASFAGLLILVVAFVLSPILLNPQSIREVDLLQTTGVAFGVGIFVAFYAAIAIVPCAFVFGIPAALVGWRLRLIRWWTCTPVGLLLGSAGALLYLVTYSSAHTTSSANGVQYWINGVPTSAGWSQFAAIFLALAVLGALGGFAFWWVWRYFTRAFAAKRVVL